MSAQPVAHAGSSPSRPGIGAGRTTASADSPARARRSREVGRITGIDLARGLAMAGMVVVHFVSRSQEPDRTLTAVADALHGRAMPLFMLLGGLGVTLLTSRSATPDRNLAIRAAMLLALGLYLTEAIDRLAIVLQTYGLLFLAAMALRRLPSKALLAMTPLVVAVGGVTYQTVGQPPTATTYESLINSSGIESLVFDGYYPIFPVAAFFVFGMWLGRLDLRSDRTAVRLAAGGVVAAIVVAVVVSAVVAQFGLVTDFGGRAGDGQFHWSRLLAIDGHSAMPVWAVSALATSTAALGLSLLIARRTPNLVRPVIAVGSMSLTFYVFQAWMTNLVPETSATTVGVEWLLAIGVFVSFTVFAMLWKTRFRSGPLERVLRVGSGPKRLSPARATASM